MRAARLNGALIHFREDGDPGGRPLLLINSLGTDLRVWDKLVPLLPDGLRLIRYDKRGHGLSELTPGPYAIDQLADDAAALLDHLDLREAILVGLSIGGLIGQSLAARRPELVRALVLMDTAAKIGDAEMWAERIATVEASGIEALADAVMQRWFSEGFAAHHAEEMAAWRNMLTRTPDAGYAACSAAIAAADFTETTRRLTIPVLAMAGDEDGSTPPDLVSATADLVEGSRYETIEQAGHLPGVERPHAVAGLILGFLQDHGLAD
ncbi:MAG: 3-oxoadipate enol-lactonase [Pseudomonadota bacterium]